ncbi:ABC transporter ATP-binding protein [Halobacteriales archaeon QS_8_69_73]|nr:MAG: ABC transporter ATP-binding protein [Halobacteriales archaeon QS_8_69_73]
MVDLDGIRVTYGDVTAVEELSLSVRDGELFCLLGPSGCGKTTTLRAVAGFESPAAGRVVLDGRDVTGLAPYDRGCATVFQDWALFPNKTVAENVAFGPKMAGVPAEQRRERAREQLAAVEMTDHADDPPGLEIKKIQERLETPMLYVTHDQEEAFTLADRIGIMNDGELVQVGAPRTVYDDPVDRFVEAFLGSTNFLSGRVVAGTGTGASVGADAVAVEFPAAGLQAPVPADDDLAIGDDVTASVRPEVVDLAPAVDGAAASTDGGAASEPDVTGHADGRAILAGTVSEVVYRGSNVRHHVAVGDGAELFVERPVTDAPGLAAGDAARLSWDVTDAYYFGPDGARIRL